MVTTDFAYIKLFPKYPDRVLLQWDLVNAFQNGTYKFTIYRSAVPDSGFKAINAAPIINHHFYEDVMPVSSEDMTLNSLFATLYYQIVCELPDGSELASRIISTEPLVNPHTRRTINEIRRKFELLCNRYIGVPAWLLKHRTFGQHCPNCWDDVKKECKDSSCLTCYGTGFTGGYFPAMNIIGQVAYREQENVFTPDRGPLEKIEKTFRTVAEIGLSKYDLLVEKDTNRRFVLFQEMQSTELRGVTVTQIFSLRELPRTHVGYQIPIEAGH